MKKYFSIGLILLIIMLFDFPVLAASRNNSCKVIDDAYYDKSGTETDKGTYLKECFSHSCEAVADVYFGKNGDIVSSSEYEKQCRVDHIDNFPDTSAFSPTLYSMLGMILIGGFFLYLIYYYS